MTSTLCFTLRFLDPVPQFHGRNDDGNPEWPPSPLRLFQALVAASAARWRGKQFNDEVRPALCWLEKLRPSILTPQVSINSYGYRMYVPNNSGDLMTSAWARGDTETSMAKFRVEKDVRPTLLRDGEAVHFLFRLTDGTCPYIHLLTAAARSITHLGWGIDMVAGNAMLLTDEDAGKLSGEHWLPVNDPVGNKLRVPQTGTLDDLVRKYGEFLNRLSDGYKAVVPLRAFRLVGYRRASDPATRKSVAFAILKPDASGYRPFDTPRRASHVAAWLRHATGEVASNWSFGDSESFVFGHAADGQPVKGAKADQRFMYLPLPSIEKRSDGNDRVGAVRRALIVAPPGMSDRINWIRRRLTGQELVWDEKPVGLLNLLPESDWVLNQYTGSFTTWSTVTPVLLPGFDDPDHLRRKLRDNRDPETQKRYLQRLDDRIEELLRKAFRQAGYSAELVGQLHLEWRQVGFRAGVELARRYEVPANLKKFPAWHVRARFPQAVGGPMAVGAGRYRGLGLFAGERST